jgi:hypothetical protein
VKNGFVSVAPKTANLRPAGDFSPKPLDAAQKAKLTSDLIRFSSQLLGKNKLYSYAFLEKVAPPLPVNPTGVAVTPLATTVPADGSIRHFVASEKVTWSISPQVGAVSAAGVYTAPSTLTDHQTVTVTATSAKDPAKTISATIALIPIPQNVAMLNADTLPDAMKTLTQWLDCHDCANLLNNMAGNLPDQLSATPFDSVRTGDPGSDSFFAFRVDKLLAKSSTVPSGTGTQPVCQELGVVIRFDFGAAAYADENGRLLSGVQVCNWVGAHYANQFWIAGEIKTHFDTLYTDIGLSPTVFVSQAGESRAIHIAESFRVGRIIFPADRNDPNTNKLAYLLLNTPDFERFPAATLHSLGAGGPIQGFLLCLPEVRGQKERQEAGRGSAVTEGAAAPHQKCDDQFLPTGDSQQSTLEYLNGLQFQQRQAELQTIGFSVDTVPEPALNDSTPNAIFRVPAVDLYIQAAAGSSVSDAPASSSRKAPAPATAPGDVASRAGTGTQSQSAEASRLGMMAEPSLANPKVTPTDPTNVEAPFLANGEYGFQVAYRPGQSVRGSVLAQGANFQFGSAKGFLSGEVGGDGAHAFGSGSVNLDYLWFAKLRRRLSLQATGSSDATAQRLLGGVMADERRTGGNAYAELDVFRNIGGFLFRLTAEPRHEMVALSPKSGAQPTFHLTTIEVGALVSYGPLTALHPTALQVSPRVKFGLGLAATEPTYRVFTADGVLHQRVSNAGLISLDFAGRFQQASSATPIFELPSLGGGDSLRGFRTDDALGRTLWSVQTEIWIPVPGSLHARPDQPVWSFLRQQIRLAADFDAGGVENTDLGSTTGESLLAAQASAAGWRYGPGVGVRFIKGSLALKLDWGYGFGQGALGLGHGRFYVGVSRIAAF